ncbi:MAG: hypothetical protein J0L58_02715 [Burkholderiales bacterium]|nr:hypothetical protein [Burkholderiales bacterium]
MSQFTDKNGAAIQCIPKLPAFEMDIVVVPPDGKGATFHADAATLRALGERFIQMAEQAERLGNARR